MSLKSELEDYFGEMAATMPAHRLATIESASRALVESEIVDRALKAGDTAPDFELRAADRAIVSLGRLLQQGPVVLSFNRGGWCPFCSLELRAYQKALPEIAEAGGSLIAVLPQTPERSRAMAERSGLTYPLLSDEGCGVAERFGIAFELPQTLRQLYSDLGHPLPHYSGTPDWKLPIPATYVIGQDGRIALADVEAHFQLRLEPLDAVAAIRKLTHAAAAAA